MERVKFKQKKRTVLKVVAVTLVVILSILAILALVYSRYGIAGLFNNRFTSNLLGLNDQQILVVPTISLEEKAEINGILGYDPVTTDRSRLVSYKDMEFSLTPQGAAYLMNSLLKNKETLGNLQIATTQKGELEISAVADVALLCEMVGQNKESIESSIGELPDKVPVYSTLSANHQTNNSSITSIKIGDMEVPSGTYTSINGYVDEGLNLFFSNALGINLDQLSVQDQTVVISGNFPSP